MRLSQFTISAALAVSTSMVAVQASRKPFKSASTFPDRFLEEDPSIQKACPRQAESVTHGRDLQGLPPAAIISNGVIKLGVNPTAQLNAPDGDFDALNWIANVGLRYILPDGSESESTAYGCECEGWGASADDTAGWANDSIGGVEVDLSSVSFSSTATTAISELVLPGGLLKVTHDFHPTPATANLYEVTVTLENISPSTINDVRYRRVMDFDIYPTPFAECVTIQPDPSMVPFFTAATDNGFNHPNPLSDLAVLAATAPFTNDGPNDHGAAFDFQFDPLAVGASYSFNIYYGAAENTAAAEEAVTKVTGEVYSFGSPSNPDGTCADTPNVYIFAFSGLGGMPMFNAPPSAVCQDLDILSKTCSVDSIDPSLLDGGSSDPNGDDIVLDILTAGPFTGGENVLTLRATDSSGLSSTCDAVVTVNCPPTAVCQNTEIPSATCSVDSIDPSLIDGGSFDPDGDAPYLSILTDGPFTGGENVVTLSATDEGGFSSTCEAVVTVNCPPTAVCQDAVVEAGPGCSVNALDPLVIGGLSSDPTGDEISLTVSGGPYPLGSHTVTLTVEDPFGFVDACVAIVTVFDGEPLVENSIDCGTDGVMSRWDESAEYTPSYIKSNGCPVQTEVSVADHRFCNSAGETMIKDAECYLSTDGTTLSVLETGPAGNHMIYNVAVLDTNKEHEASKTCTICVEEPDDGSDDKDSKSGDSSTKSSSSKSSSIKRKTKSASTKSSSTKSSSTKSKSGDSKSRCSESENSFFRDSTPKKSKSSRHLSSQDGGYDSRGGDRGGTMLRGLSPSYSRSFKCPSNWTPEDSFQCNDSE